MRTVLKSNSLARTFPLGQCVVTAGLNALCEERALNLGPYFLLHSQGNWGELGHEDTARQNASIASNEPTSLHSVWTLKGLTIWIITEWDRSVTTALLPEEY